MQSKMGRVDVKEARGTKTFHQYTVGIPAIRIAPISSMRVSFYMVNNDGQTTVYLGDEDVTVADGIPVAAAASFEDLSSRDEWWAVTAGAQVDLRICITEVDG